MRAFLLARVSPADRTVWDPFISVIEKADCFPAPCETSADCFPAPCETFAESPESVESRGDRSSDYFSYSSDSVSDSCLTVDRSFVGGGETSVENGEGGAREGREVGEGAREGREVGREESCWQYSQVGAFKQFFYLLLERYYFLCIHDLVSTVCFV